MPFTWHDETDEERRAKNREFFGLAVFAVKVLILFLIAALLLKCLGR